MRIDELTGGNSEIQSINKVNSSSGKSVKNVQFKNELNAAGSKTVNDELAQKLKEIEAQGNVLVRKADLSEFVRYKKMVKDFLSLSLDGFQEFRRNDFFDQRGRRRVYSTVEKVNDKLQNMTDSFLQDQKDQINLLACVDDIRGLLVDLML